MALTPTALQNFLGRVGFQALVCSVFFSKFKAGLFITHPRFVRCLAEGGGVDAYPLLCIYWRSDDVLIECVTQSTRHDGTAAMYVLFVHYRHYWP